MLILADIAGVRQHMFRGQLGIRSVSEAGPEFGKEPAWGAGEEYRPVSWEGVSSLVR